MKLKKLFVLFVLLFSLFFVATANAGLVYGHVYDESGKSVINKQLAFRELQDYNKNGKLEEFKTATDANGYYSVSLPPGMYRVECEGKEAFIQSHPQPLKQDIVLRKKQG